MWILNSSRSCFARVYERLAVGRPKQRDWAEKKYSGKHAFVEINIILMRKDPPFDMEYIYSTYAMELLSGQDLVANKPQSLRDANEKFFTLNFPQCCPQP